MSKTQEKYKRLSALKGKKSVDQTKLKRMLLVLKSKENIHQKKLEMALALKSTKGINKTKLEELLDVPPSIIKYFIKQKILKFKKVGRENIYSKQSIKKLLLSFNRYDYLRNGEVVEKLRRWRFTSVWVVDKRAKRWDTYYANPLGIEINGTKLIKGGEGIPSKYLLSVRLIGKTKYITRTSFAKTLNWLRSINHKLNPNIYALSDEELMVVTDMMRRGSWFPKKNKEGFIVLPTFGRRGKPKVTKLKDFDESKIPNVLKERKFDAKRRIDKKAKGKQSTVLIEKVSEKVESEISDAKNETIKNSELSKTLF